MILRRVAFHIALLAASIEIGLAQPVVSVRPTPELNPIPRGSVGYQWEYACRKNACNGTVSGVSMNGSATIKVTITTTKIGDAYLLMIFYLASGAQSGSPHVATRSGFSSLGLAASSPPSNSLPHVSLDDFELVSSGPFMSPL
jgi:hypothetical protein